MFVIGVYVDGVKLILKIRWESGFLRRCSMEPPPYALTEVWGTFNMQLSVKVLYGRTSSVGTVTLSHKQRF